MGVSAETLCSSLEDRTVLCGTGSASPSWLAKEVSGIHLGNGPKVRVKALQDRNNVRAERLRIKPKIREGRSFLLTCCNRWRLLFRSRGVQYDPSLMLGNVGSIVDGQLGGPVVRSLWSAGHGYTPTLLKPDRNNVLPDSSKGPESLIVSSW